MTKQRWRGPLNSLGNHFDPRKEEQLKCLKIDIEDRVKNILNITKNINHGNKERNLRKKSEAIQLIEDFHKQYESLYSLYVDLREELKKKVGGEDDISSSSSSDSDTETHDRNNKVSSATSNVSDSDNNESKYSDLDNTIFKDKLACSSEVKKTMYPEPEPEQVFKDLGVQREETESMSQIIDRIKDLEGEVNVFKLEFSTLYTEKRQLEEQVECKSNEAIQVKEKISRLESQILEMEATSKEKECEFDSLRERFVARANDMQLELNELRHQKDELEARLLAESEEWSCKVKSSTEKVNSLQQELENVNIQKDELKQKLEKESEETSECLIQIEALKKELSLSEQRTAKEKERTKVQVNDLELEIESLSKKNRDVEEQANKIKHEALQSSVEKETLRRKISELQKALSERSNGLSIEQMKYRDSQTIMSVKIKSLAEEVEHLKSKLESLQNEKQCLKVELQEVQKNKNILQRKLEKERENSSQLEKICRTNFQNVEKKVEEMAEEFRKQYDDQLRILNQRIRVAEKLQAESKEGCRTAKVTCAQEIKELKEKAERMEIELKDVQDLTLTANELLASLDLQALNFAECTDNLVYRISKASCELNFTKQWAMRKSKSLFQVKEDIDSLLRQLDDKEAEILAMREKSWKSENKVRELEKMIKEREDEVVVRNEEKREAIRQLCVWIDYHRSGSDFYKKMLSDMNTGRRKAS